MNYFERRKILKEINTMDLIPVRVHGNDMEENRVVVKVPKFESSFMHFLAPMTQKLFYSIKLDELGSSTWTAIDGKRNAREICDFVRENNQEDENLADLDDRLTKYLMMLYERRFISFQQILNN